jgi:hypothetical protein
MVFPSFIASLLVELAFAAGFAVLAHLLYEALPEYSWPRAVARHLQNKLAERSVARLEARIEELERYVRMFRDDSRGNKTLYVNLLRAALAILTLIALGAACSAFEQVWPSLLPPSQMPPRGLAALCYLVGVLVGLAWLVPLKDLDSERRLAKRISKLESEIATLRKKLVERRAARPAPSS